MLYVVMSHCHIIAYPQTRGDHGGQEDGQGGQDGGQHGVQGGHRHRHLQEEGGSYYFYHFTQDYFSAIGIIGLNRKLSCGSSPFQICLFAGELMKTFLREHFPLNIGIHPTLTS